MISGSLSGLVRRVCRTNWKHWSGFFCFGSWAAQLPEYSVGFLWFHKPWICLPLWMLYVPQQRITVTLIWADFHVQRMDGIVMSIELDGSPSQRCVVAKNRNIFIHYFYLNQVFFVRKPNQLMSTALSHHWPENLLICQLDWYRHIWTGLSTWNACRDIQPLRDIALSQYPAT